MVIENADLCIACDHAILIFICIACKMLSERQCLECYTIVISTCRSISLITFQSGCFTAKNPVDCSCVKIKLVNCTLITHGNKNLICVSVCI